jgi:hypothetical protein
VLLDVFSVAECFKAELGEVEQRSAADCYVMEAEQSSSKELLVLPLLTSLSLAAAESLKTNDWVKLQLGFFGLVGLSARLELKPKGSQNRAKLLGHTGPVLGLVPDPGSYSGSWFGSCFRSGCFLRFWLGFVRSFASGELSWAVGVVALGVGGHDSYAGGRSLGTYVGVS